MDRINIIGVVGWDIEEESVIRQINDSDGDIEFFIATPGGYIMPGINILNSIREYKKGSTTAIISYAASMGTQIALACDYVKVFDNAPFMIHNASGIAWGDYREMERYGNYLKRLNGNLANLYSKKSGKSNTEILKLMDDETWYYGKEIVDSGFADEVIDEEPEVDQDTLTNTAKENMIKAERAMAEEHLSAEQFADAFKKCFDGSCSVNLNNNSEHEILGVNPASAQIEIQNKENSMEYTKETFEALQADHAEALKKKEEEAVKLERDRVAGITSLNGDAEFTKKAIEEGFSVGDAAIALLKEKDKVVAKKKTDFEAAAEELNDIELGEEVDLSKEELAKKEADEALANYGGKK